MHIPRAVKSQKFDLKIFKFIFDFRIFEIWKWSDDNSKHEVSIILFLSTPLMTQKSIKSGILDGSEGQYVGSPVEIWHKFSLFIAANNDLPLYHSVLMQSKNEKKFDVKIFEIGNFLTDSSSVCWEWSQIGLTCVPPSFHSWPSACPYYLI